MHEMRCGMAGDEQVGNLRQSLACEGDGKEHAPNAAACDSVCIGQGDRRHENLSGIEEFEGWIQGLVADIIEDDVDVLNPLLETCCLHVKD
jgi:hypothetical protein